MANKFINPVPKPCHHCGAITLKPMYCGNACKVAAHKQRNPDRARSYRNREAERRRIANAARVRVVTLRGRPKAEPKPVPTCMDCPTALTEKWQRRCAPCAERQRLYSLRHQPSRRADKARRKAQLRGKAKDAERFDPLEILARDGWRCHICGISTPKRLRGTYHDQAPELDHIIPLAMGGKHTRLNTACACRRCNMLKGSTALGQLRLVA